MYRVLAKVSKDSEPDDSKAMLDPIWKSLRHRLDDSKGSPAL
jgi:hypothetical protein